ncbi:MAG: hypothetical protein JXA00_02960 [Candidatus Thermoplasmatota archaeon]|nr:hypothetical protein [Candidatus Thermoplasmatota archaeon]
MKHILIIGIVGLLVLSTFGAFAQPSTPEVPVENNLGVRDFTHTVFAEFATATWCGYCHYAHTALKNIIQSGDYPFFYTSLVDDKNTHSAQRIDEYNIYGYPTVYFDGGYKVNVGGGTGNEAQFRSSIVSTGARTVADVEITLNVTWLGNAAMNIAVGVQNNEATSYGGRLRVYVTEVGSSLGWKDTSGKVYTYPFLDYAYNQVLSIAAGNTWSSSMVWDGHNYNNGLGVNFGSIQYGNIEVIAVVFNPTPHTGYSYPPSGYPFTAYYVDDAVGVRVGENTPPITPHTPSPTNGSTNVLINKILSWQGGDVNPFDTVTYDVYFGTTSPPPKVASNQSSASYNPGLLSHLTTYYWKIVSWDNHGASTQGPLWQFTTKANSPPNTPSNPNPANGATNVPINAQLSWTGGDPDTMDTVTYDVYFGTSSPPPLVVSNKTGANYNPGTMPYTTQYYWKVVSWDNYGLSAQGPEWEFITGEEPNIAPDTPSISGPASGKPGKSYVYKVTGTDPDGDNLYYYIDWADGTITDWDGPHTPGAEISFTHSWEEKGTYTVKVKSKDVYGLESDWGELEVKIPTKFLFPHLTFSELLQRLLERFPLLERLLIH